METNPSHSTAYSRRIQIIKLLYENGPLTAAAIQNLIQPEMQRRRVNDALTRLTESGLISKRFNGMPLHGSGQFYQLSGKVKFQSELADLACVGRSVFQAPLIRNQELYHSLSCAYVAESLRRIFPEAEIVRDFRLREHPIAEDILLMDPKSLDTPLPDIMLCLYDSEGKEEVFVAVEVELSRKSHRRIRDKLQNYALGTKIDGMIWLCGEEVAMASIMRIWRSMKEDPARHARGYRDFFALFLEGHKPLFPEERMATAKGWACRLNDWIHILRTNAPANRTDALFQTTGLPPAQIS